MNTVLFDGKEFLESDDYSSFMAENSGLGRLKIRAYAASEALPVPGLRIVVSTQVGSFKVVFFDGVTDASGMIENLSLPAPKMDVNNLVAPKALLYQIEAIYPDPFMEKDFQVNIYDDVCVVQNINFVPGGSYGD